MNTDLRNDLPLKLYLLGDLSGEEQHRLEQRLLIDSSAFEELRWAEDELIDEYLDGTLSDYEKEKFESFFLSAPERHQKLSFAKALKRYVATHKKQNHVSLFWRNSWQAIWHPQNQVLKWALAASLLLMIAGGSWAALQISRLQNALGQAGARESREQLVQLQGRYSELTAALQSAQTRNRQLEQQVADRKSGERTGLSALLPGQLKSTLIAVVLTPGRTRDFGGSQKIRIPANTDLVQLSLKMEPQDYTQYQATIQRVGEDKIWSQTSPQTGSDMEGEFLRLIVPVKILSPDDYVLKLGGVTAAGGSEEIGSYYFRIVQ